MHGGLLLRIDTNAHLGAFDGQHHRLNIITDTAIPNGSSCSIAACCALWQTTSYSQIKARHQRMPPQEAGYTYAVEPTAVNSLFANEEESIYGHSNIGCGRYVAPLHTPLADDD